MKVNFQALLLSAVLVSGLQGLEPSMRDEIRYPRPPRLLPDLRVSCSSGFFTPMRSRSSNKDVDDTTLRENLVHPECPFDYNGTDLSGRSWRAIREIADGHGPLKLNYSQAQDPNSVETSSHQRYVRARKMEIWEKTPSIVLAALFEDVEATKNFIAEGEDVDSSDPNGSTGLMYSGRSGNLEIVQVLVNAAASVDKRDLSGATALLYAAGNANTSVMKFLLRKGADPLIKTLENGTLLHAAVSSGDVQTVRDSLVTGQDINAQMTDGTTPLILAALQRRSRVLELLVESGADVNIIGPKGLTALIAATTDDVAFTQGDVKSVATLVQHGADVDAADARGRTPLIGAALYGGTDVVRFLLQHGADLAARDERGRTAMSIALQNKRSDMVECFRAGGR